MGANDRITNLTAKVVAAFVARNATPTSELTNVISTVHSTLMNLHSNSAIALAVIKKQKPAVPLRHALHETHIVCLEDGLKFKSLSRHLGVHHNMTPDEYRKKWNLPADYPMVAPAYSKERSRIAKEFRFGHTVFKRKKKKK